MKPKKKSASNGILEIKNIVCATDLSLCSLGALPWAAEFARLYKARLTIVHVLERWDERYDFLSNKMERRLEKEARAQARKHAALIGKSRSIHAKAEVTKGHPVIEIMKAIKKIQPDLVVVGSHGKGGFDRLTLGSVSEKLVKVSPATVLVVRGNPPVKIKNIACAIDGSPSSLLSLEWATDIAVRSGCKHVALCNAFEVPIGFSRAGMSLKTVTERIRQVRREQLAAAMKVGKVRQEIETRQIIMHGPIAPTICRIAEHQKADLLVVGARGRTALGGMLLGSIAMKVLRSAKMSVLAVKSPKHIVDVWEALKSL